MPVRSSSFFSTNAPPSEVMSPPAARQTPSAQFLWGFQWLSEGVEPSRPFQRGDHESHADSDEEGRVKVTSFGKNVLSFPIYYGSKTVGNKIRIIRIDHAPAQSTPPGPSRRPGP